MCVPRSLAPLIFILTVSVGQARLAYSRAIDAVTAMAPVAAVSATAAGGFAGGSGAGPALAAKSTTPCVSTQKGPVRLLLP